MGLKIKHVGVGDRTGSWVQVGPTFSIPMDGYRYRHAMFMCDCGRHELRCMRKVAVNSGPCLQCRMDNSRSRKPEYDVWRGMLSRCSRKNDVNYGGRGISVCERWRRSFEDFLEDMGPRPGEITPGGRAEYSIDRIDNNGNYEPGNCKWSTLSEQQSNTRRNVMVEVNGRLVTASEAAREYGLEPQHVIGRLRLGWSHEEALTTPVSPKSRSKKSLST